MKLNICAYKKRKEFLKGEIEKQKKILADTEDLATESDKVLAESYIATFKQQLVWLEQNQKRGSK